MGRRRGIMLLCVAGFLAPAITLLFVWVANTPRPQAKDAAAARRKAPARIIVYVIDGLRPVNLDAYGYSRPTAPTIRQLAGEGARFERCFSNSTWSLDSISSLFVGMHGAIYSPEQYNPGVPHYLDVLPEYVREAGWATGIVTENPHVTDRYGLTQGFEFVGDSSVLLASSDAPVKRRAAMSETTGAYLESFIEQFGGRNFFLYVHTMETHAPLAIPAGVEPFYEAGTTPRQDLAGWYDTAVRWADQNLARFIGLLEEHGLYQDTLLIVTADHGESLDAGQAAGGHRGPPFLDRIHVPLIVSWPGGIRGGAVFRENVQLLDLGPTIFDAAGLCAPAQFQGQSLLRLLVQGNDETLRDRPLFMAGQSMDGRGTLKGDWYLFSRKGSDRLYDLSGGPDEAALLTEHNDTKLRELTALADGHFAAQRRYYERFERALKWRRLAFVKELFRKRRGGAEAGGKPPMDESHRKALEALGYLE